MSGSEKVQRASLAEERERAFQRDRALAAARAEFERRQRERDIIAKRNADLRAELQRQLLSTVEPMRRLRATKGESTAPLEAERERLVRAADKAPDSESLTRLRLESAELQQRIRDTQAQVDIAESVRRMVPTIAKELDEVSLLLAALEPELSDASDPRGQADLENQITSARTALQEGRIPVAEELARRARKALSAHSKKVSRARANRAARAPALQAQLAEVEARLAALEADPNVLHSSGTELASIREDLNRAATALASGAWSDVEHLSSSMVDRLALCVSVASSREEAEQRRGIIVDAFYSVLSRRFRCDEPQLADPSNPDSAVVIVARKPGGPTTRREREVHVHADGTVSQHFRGYPLERGSDRKPEAHRTCDDALAELQVEQSELAREFGVQTTAPRWKGMARPDEPSSDTGSAEYNDEPSQDPKGYEL